MGEFKKKSINFPILGFNVSGGIRIIINIANGLAASGHIVCFIVPDYSVKVPFELSDKINIKILRTRGKTFWRKLNYFLKLCVISTRGSDICFASGFKTPYCIFLSKLINISSTKLIYLIQGYEPLSHVEQIDGNYLGKKMLFTLALLSYQLPFKQIAVSGWIKNKIGKKSINVINNGIDINLFSRGEYCKKSNKFTVGIIGSSAKWKGYSTFLMGIRKIPSQDRLDLKVIVASQVKLDLPLIVESELIKPVNDEEMIYFYRKCDVFVFPSFIEGFGLPPLEAMACGVPVITSDCGGITAFANEKNAIIVPAGDANAIAEALVKLKRDSQLRSQLASGGLETSKNFSLENMTRKYCQIVKTI